MKREKVKELRELSFNELMAFIKENVKPFKVLEKGKGWFRGEYGFTYEEDKTEGFDYSDIDKIVSVIEEREDFTKQEKINLETEIAKRVNESGNGRYTTEECLGRGTLNILLMIKKGVEGFQSRFKLSSVNGLKKHALVYTKVIKTKKVITYENVSDNRVLGLTERQSQEKFIYDYAICLTEYAKDKINNRYSWNSLENKAKRIVQKDLHNLRMLGEI